MTSCGTYWCVVIVSRHTLQCGSMECWFGRLSFNFTLFTMAGSHIQCKTLLTAFMKLSDGASGLLCPTDLIFIDLLILCS